MLCTMAAALEMSDEHKKVGSCPTASSDNNKGGTLGASGCRAGGVVAQRTMSR